MKKIIILFFISVVAFVGWQFAKQQNIFSPIILKPLQVEKKEVKEENKSKRYGIHILYPQFSGISDTKAQKVLNGRVYSFSQSSVKKFKEGVANLDTSLVAEDLSSGLEITYTVSNATTHTVSVEFLVTEYWAGAAHPNSISETFNYNVLTQREINLSDIFKKDSDHLDVLSEYSIKILKDRLDPKLDNTSFLKEWIEKGAAPQKDNFSNFLLGKKNLVIIFDPYQVGPYALGFQKVEIQYEKLKDILAINPPNF